MESERQYEFISKLKVLYEQKKEQCGRDLTYHIATFGCQMNARDSEKLAGILSEIGYVYSESEESDFVLYNTCSVRENANTKVYGRIGRLSVYKKKNPDMLIAICGCMMQEKTEEELIRTKYKFVDIVFGTHNIFQLAELIYKRLSTGERVFEVWKEAGEIVENLPNERKYSFKSGVNITYGCDNFCSYCIVPYVRGRERSRLPIDILREIEMHVKDGVKEIMLLGQNVNSYGKGLENPITFAELLRQICRIDGLLRVRFMTPHPKDFSDELLTVMKENPKICRHIHLPLQSGSSRILKLMNRHYTKEDYLSLVEKIKSVLPDVSLTTDIIVGFPGESEEDFADTLLVVNKCEFDSAFTFIYSKREGTIAAGMENQVPEAVIKERFQRLLEAVQRGAEKRIGMLVGKVLPVLCEGLNEQEEGYVTGRLANNTLVHFKASASLVGQIVDVRLSESKGFYYIGELV